MTDEEMSELGQIVNLPTQIEKVCQEDNVEELKKILSKGVTYDIINHHYINDMTPLSISYKKGKDTNYRVFRFLLEHPLININSKGQSSDTVLHLACKDHNIEIINLLLSQEDIDANVKNLSDKTPLIEAVFDNNDNNIKIVKLLIPYSIINMGDANENTPLHIAIQHKKIEIVKLLLEQSTINVNIGNSQRKTPLHVSFEVLNNFEIIRLLLEHPNIDTGVFDQYQATPLLLACSNSYLASYYHSNLSLFKLLVNKSSSYINTMDSLYKTPLKILCEYSAIPMLKILLEHPNIKNTVQDYKINGKYSLPVVILLNNRFKKERIEKINNILDDIIG